MTNPLPTEQQVAKALFPDFGGDASYNLEGVIADLEGPFNPNDGGVCVRSIRRVVIQLEQARALLAAMGEAR